jgi:hypothetical protein
MKDLRTVAGKADRLPATELICYRYQKKGSPARMDRAPPGRNALGRSHRMQPDPPFADPTLAYMAACGEVQIRLRDVLTQLAGFALLLATRRSRPSLQPPPIDVAEARAAEAAEMLHGLRPPGEAAHHFHHLAAAADAVGRAVRGALACSTARSDENDRDELLRALRAAAAHLHVTARLLPGFELVDLRQACCAAHAAPAALSCADAGGRGRFNGE